MAIVDITEYQRLAVDQQGEFIQTGIEPGIRQQVAIGAGSVQSSAFDQSTLLVRVHADAPARIEFGANPTASGASARIAAGASEYFGVRPGHKIAVITTT
jgi:hypothetical protein